MRSKKRSKKKKIDITGLLDITYDEKTESKPYIAPKYPRYFSNSFSSRESFLLSTFSFCLNKRVLGKRILKPEFLRDPDHLFPWDSVEYVVFRSESLLFCPICLEEGNVVAPMVTKCGHLFCQTCIYEYFKQNGKTVLKCPVCKVLVEKKRLKYCKVETVTPLKLNSRVKFRKIYRKRNCCNVFNTGPRYEARLDGRYAKLSELGSESVERECGVGKYFICDDMSYLEILRGNYTEILAFTEGFHDKQIIGEILGEMEKKMKAIEDEFAIDDPGEDEQEGEVDISRGGEETKKKEESNDEKKMEEEEEELEEEEEEKVEWLEMKNPHVFYACTTHPNVFIHDLNFQMLTEDYGAPQSSNFPELISGRVLDTYTFILTESRRVSRKSNFGHLPLGSVVRIVEISTKEFISRATYRMFKEDILRRRRRRENVKRREEAERRAKFEREEAERLKRVKECKKRTELLTKYEQNFPEQGLRKKKPGEDSSIVAGREKNGRKKKAKKKKISKKKVKGVWGRKDKHVSKFEKIFGYQPGSGSPKKKKKEIENVWVAKNMKK